MCDTCGCNVTPGNKHLIEIKGKLSLTSDGKSAINVLQNLLSENDHQAAHNRQHFDKHHVLAINLMSSPGSGKTALLEATIDALASEFNIAVIEGDLETENDAERIRARGVPAIQIATGTACHLDAHMVHDALHHLDLAPLDIVFIENVGNLVCPASFDLGHHRNVTLLSVTEGDDKPAKYPVMFRAADLMLVSKTDLLAVLDDFDPARAEHHLRHLANEAPVIEVSVKNSDNLAQWLNWLRQEMEQHRLRLSKGESLRPAMQPDGMRLHTDSSARHAHHQHDHG
jgi:hydrogenase nickel incorporation protein HypB